MGRIGGNCKGNLGLGFDVEFRIEKGRFDSCKERLRNVFDELLVAFLREKSSSKCMRPIPALCGDGRPVDLFKLFWIVRKVGGHIEVSRNNLWGFVSEECGLGFGVIPFVKLIYMKYLNELDEWLKEVFSTSDLEDGFREVVRKLDLLCFELENGIRGLCNGSDRSGTAGRVHQSIVYGANEVKKAVNEANGFCQERLDGKFGDDDAATEEIIDRVINKVLKNKEVVADEKVVKKINSKANDLAEEIAQKPQRRKRPARSFSGMLRWLTRVAKHSNDPSIGPIPECSKWRDYGAEELWMQALLAREALKIRRNPNAIAQQSLLENLKKKKLSMHPSMYDDNVCNSQSSKKPRYSTRIPSSTRANLCPCCNSCPARKSENTIRQEKEVVNDVKAPEVTDFDKPPTFSNDHKSSQVSVGPLFQAEVPEWTGLRSESDPKWLGTKMWQPGGDMSNSQDGLGLVGKGRSSFCACPFPYSVECVRFHIAEKRFKLKQEIRSLFYHWKFDRMGEEVSLSWTEEEEKTFKDMMKSNARFPNNASRFLPNKTMQNLISYYFNVFLVGRRSYQNRVTPKDINSDDDEKECGSIGSGFGYKALYVPGLGSISCVLNKKLTELG